MNSRFLHLWVRFKSGWRRSKRLSVERVDTFGQPICQGFDWDSLNITDTIFIKRQSFVLYMFSSEIQVSDGKKREGAGRAGGNHGFIAVRIKM